MHVHRIRLFSVKEPDSELVAGLADAADHVLLGDVHDDSEGNVDGREEGEHDVQDCNMRTF
jgi:hypothetical protein